MLCRRNNLTTDDMEIMTVGMCLDYIGECIEMNDPKEQKTRQASQSDFDSF